MKKLYTLALSMLIAANLFAQGVCDPSANVIIFSNYDGGTLNINIDQNIPNIKIGIVSYEAAAINITGTYAGNVTEVRYAGYNGTSNTNCTPNVPSTSINSGSWSDTIISFPQSTYNNTNGYQYIICNYSCDNQTNQGGCNTPDQIVHYFITNFGGALLFHQTQYGCWSSNTTYNISAGGNCSISPFATAVNEASAEPQVSITPNPASDVISIDIKGASLDAEVEIMNLLGEVVLRSKSAKAINVSGLKEGVYLARVMMNDRMVVRRFVVGR